MWKTTFLSACYFHTSANWSAKLGKVMKKVMGQTSKKKRNFVDSPILPTAEMFSKGNHQRGSYSGSARRIAVLNKLFMKNVTDIMVTGEYASEFFAYGIEINRIKIAPDYKTLNVFWVARGTDTDEEIEKLLKKNAGFLRHELSSLGVMGNVPLIQFVKDRQYAKTVEVDNRLLKADFGDDHVPVDVTTKLKTEFELFTSLPLNVKDEIKKLEDETVDEIHEEPLPPMPQNVFGLDHADILNRIKKSMKKSKALHRVHGDECDLVKTLNENPVEYATNKEQREAFKNFLAKREALRLKARKRDQKYFPDLEYMKEEIEQRQKHYFDSLDLEIYDDEDYADEDYNFNKDEVK